MTKTARLLLTILLTFAWITQTEAQDNADHVRLTNLPHVYINTFTGGAVVSKTAMVYARMWYVDEQDQVSYYDSLQIRVRGNSTADLAKKPYRLKFNEKVKLLGKGRPNTKKWTLLANHGDKTMLRNALTSLMGEYAGLPFNPAAKFVDLTMNGKYAGTYQLSDQVDVRPHRVDVVEQDLPLTNESNITGGYLLEADGFKEFSTSGQGANNSPSGFMTNRQVPVRIHYPDEEDIARSQYSYIRTFITNFERRLFSATFTDPLTGYRPLVDSTTLVNWYVCTEICANPDGFFSTFFYKNQDDDHLYWGPLWDYDIAYNNDNRTDRGGTSTTERQLMKDYGYGGYGSGCKEWVARMWDDPWFARLVNRRFQELVDGGLEVCLNQKLDSLVDLIDASQQLNYQRWGINTRTLRERVLYSTYDRYVTDVRTFIQRHLLYLKSAFSQLLPDSPVPEPEEKDADFQADSRSYYTIFNVGTGTCFDVDPTSDEVCGNRRDESSESQQWRIIKLANGYMFIVNRATGLALCDPSPDGTTATTNTGGYIHVAEQDSTDARQMWDIVSQEDGRYNIISRWSEHAANLSGGNAADGTPVLSYVSDDRNSSSANRLWRIEITGTVVETGIGRIAQDYALAYDPLTGLLHFGADNLQELTFPVTVYDASGRRIATFTASEPFSMLPCPAGLYIVTWKHDGRQHSVKMTR